MTAAMRRDPALIMLAAAFATCTGLLGGGGIVYAFRNTRIVTGGLVWTDALWQLWPASLAAIGFVLVLARPRVLVGWGLLAAGFSMMAAFFGGAYGGWARLTGARLPLVAAATWLGVVAKGSFVMAAPLVVSRLPSGHTDRRSTQMLSRVSWVVGGALLVWRGLSDESLAISSASGSDLGVRPLPNPIALVHLGGSAAKVVTATLTFGLVACGIIGLALLVLRLRSATATERAQVRWLGMGLAALPAGILIIWIGPSLMPWLSPQPAEFLLLLVAVIGLSAIPVSIAVSVSKFHLFEIDRLVSRTVSFALVVMVLGSTYTIVAVLPFTAVAGANGTEVPSWMVAAFTLGAFAAFAPLRRRIQRVVDRRFSRTRYDAESLSVELSARLSTETNLHAISGHWLDTVVRALQPSAIAVWTKE